MKKNNRINIVKSKTNKPIQKIEIGQTLETNDVYLPHKKNKKPEAKTRPIITVEINKNGELVVVPCSTKKTSHTTKYKKYGISYYRHNIEIVDNEGKPIRVGTKFQLNNKCSKLPIKEAKHIEEHVLNHTKFSSENRKKLRIFKNRNKKRKN